MMEIEIITTKKKISMSLVKQMELGSLSDLKYAMIVPQERILGYVNEYPYSSGVKIPVIIFRAINDWKVFPAFLVEEKDTNERVHVDKDGKCPYEYYGRDTVFYHIKQKLSPKLSRTWSYKEDKDKRDEQLKLINKFVKFGKGLHIYL